MKNYNLYRGSIEDIKEMFLDDTKYQSVQRIKKHKSVEQEETKKADSVHSTNLPKTTHS
jgi:hypothetical protein